MSTRDASQDGSKRPAQDAFNPEHSSQANGTQHEEDSHKPISPLQMPPALVSDLEPGRGSGSMSDLGQAPHRRLPGNHSPRLQIPGTPSLGGLAMAAVQYLPYPLMVLDNQKTLVMANEAMGRLLDIEDREAVNGEETSIVERLWGKTLSEMGIDVLQNGRPVWVIWDTFLDAVAHETDRTEDEDQQPEGEVQARGGPVAPAAESTEPWTKNAGKTNFTVNDTVVEVVISPADISTASWGERDYKAAPKHTYAKMIITVWALHEERYFTLSFTNTDTHQTPLPSSRRQMAGGTKKRSPQSKESRPPSSPFFDSSRHSSIYRRASIGHAVTDPMDLSPSASVFPPLGPPSQTTFSHASSTIQKLFVMKDAFLDSTEVPIVAMWKDLGLTIANKAARKLFHTEAKLSDVKNGYGFLSQWHVWDESFTHQLEYSEYPISVLIRTQQPFTSHKVGLVDPETGRKKILNCSGEAIRDETTGEFLAGMVTASDITNMTEKIKEIKAKDEQRFQLICDTMPQMIWTSTREGMAEWFSERW
jgi:hypothetical protein